jgi:hypothetical protein
MGKASRCLSPPQTIHIAGKEVVEQIVTRGDRGEHIADSPRRRFRVSGPLGRRADYRRFGPSVQFLISFNSQLVRCFGLCARRLVSAGKLSQLLDSLEHDPVGHSTYDFDFTDGTWQNKVHDAITRLFV